MSAPAGINHAARLASWRRLWAILLSADEPAERTAPDPPANDEAAPVAAGAASETPRA